MHKPGKCNASGHFLARTHAFNAFEAWYFISTRLWYLIVITDIDLLWFDACGIYIFAILYIFISLISRFLYLIHLILLITLLIMLSTISRYMTIPSIFLWNDTPEARMALRHDHLTSPPLQFYHYRNTYRECRTRRLYRDELAPN
jgi:hypothetical protein